MTFSEIEIPLASISGRSRLNPRQTSAPAEKIEEIAATIVECGLIEPPLAIAENGGYAMLNGGNRLDALRLLQDRSPQHPIVVRVRLFEGDEIAAREAAAAVSLTQTALHPVDKIEAFSAMAGNGRAVEDIARIFNETTIDVRRHIKLASLSPIVRGLWRSGEITRDVAIAFTHGTPEAQEALIETRAVKLTDAFAIARKLRADTLDADCREAKFLGQEPGAIDAYRANGGAIEEDLFAERPVFLQAPIAYKTVDALLLAKAEAIAEDEGWGRASLVDDGDYPEVEEIKLDYTKDEKARMAEIADARKTEPDEQKRVELRREAEAIDAKALLRAIPKKRRAGLAVVVELDFNGFVTFTRAVTLNAPRDDEPEQSEPAARPSCPAPSAPAPLPPTEKIGKAEKIIRVEAINAALRQACAEDATLAAVFLVAALGCQWGREGIAIASEHAIVAQPKSELLRKIRGEKFATALLSCAQAAAGRLQAPITNAFAELIGRHIQVEDASPEIANLLLTVASRFDDIGERVADAFDYPEYFRAVGKSGAIEAIRETAGDAEARTAEKLKPKPLVARAAQLAANKGWLPPDLAAACAAPAPAREPPQSTAEAMTAAIDADEAGEEKALLSDVEQMRIFLLSDAVLISAGAATPQPALVKAFRAFAEERGWDRLTVAAIARALVENGVERRIEKGTPTYFAIKLADAPTGGNAVTTEAPDEKEGDGKPVFINDVDRVRLFIEEVCERVKDASVKAEELAARYDPFGALRGFPPLSYDEFFAAMATNGFPKKYSSIKGLRLKAPAPAKGKQR
jgi:ParB family chromosome partitioning protein